jgi:DNA-directed RNA polymerase subunit N (RpoN/RPB10)
MLAQRIYQIACGYEDCNDADDLRFDPLFKTAVGRCPQSGRDLASQPTLSRFENLVTRTQLRRLAEVFVELFLARYRGRGAQRIILDFDSTDDETHGQQQFAQFHGFYDEYCYLPLLVTATVDGGPEELLVAMLRPGRSHAAAQALGVLRRLVARLREAFPQAQVLLRADSGFALPEIYDWCEQEPGLDYLISLAQNARLRALAEPHLEDARAAYEETGERIQHFREEWYAAKSWAQERRVVIKAEVSAEGDNPRFVVTSLSAGQAQDLYEDYGQRGEMENRIKELKDDLKMDRTSCHRFEANQFRVFLHAAAFVLCAELRRQLQGTVLAEAQVSSLQRWLFKLGVRVRETVRRIWLEFASACPLQELWPLLLARLRAAPT